MRAWAEEAGWALHAECPSRTYLPPPHAYQPGVQQRGRRRMQTAMRQAALAQRLPGANSSCASAAARGPSSRRSTDTDTWARASRAARRHAEHSGAGRERRTNSGCACIALLTLRPSITLHFGLLPGLCAVMHLPTPGQPCLFSFLPPDPPSPHRPWPPESFPAACRRITQPVAGRQQTPN